MFFFRKIAMEGFADSDKFEKDNEGFICFKNPDGSYLSVAKRMRLDALLELENKSIPPIDCIVQAKYNNPRSLEVIQYLPRIKTPRPFVVKPHFNKANKRVRGKTRFWEEYRFCPACRTHHTDETIGEICEECVNESLIQNERTSFDDEESDVASISYLYGGFI